MKNSTYSKPNSESSNNTELSNENSNDNSNNNSNNPAIKVGTFIFNPKCIAFSITVVILYWVLPKKNPWLLPLLFFGSYIGMGWYDHAFNCVDRFKSAPGKGLGGTFTSWAKPPVMKEGNETRENLEYQHKEYSRSVNKFHVFVVAPLLLAIAVFGNKLKNTKNSNLFWNSLIIFAVLVGLYHLFRFFSPRINHYNDNAKNYLEKISGNKQAIYAFHVSVVVPYLIYLAMKRGVLDTPTMILTAFIAVVNIGYHGYKAFF